MHVMTTLLIGAVLLMVPGAAQAGSAAEDINVQAERILAVLADPQLKVPGQERARRLAVRRVAEQAIDFGETGRRTLGTHWDARTDAERQRFVTLFTDLLDRAFLRHVDRWDGEQLVIAGDTVEGDRPSAPKGSSETARGAGGPGRGAQRRRTLARVGRAGDGR